MLSLVMPFVKTYVIYQSFVATCFANKLTSISDITFWPHLC